MYGKKCIYKMGKKKKSKKTSINDKKYNDIIGVIT